MFTEGYRELFLESQYLSNQPSETLDAIIASISRERLTAYSATAASDVEALALYELNARLCNCLHELIGGLEIALRNAICSAVIDHYGRQDWYRARVVTRNLSPERRKNIREVRARLQAQHQDERSGRIISGLTFHFWVAIHENKYRDIFWTPFLHKVWPAGSNIKQVHKDLLKMRDLRNRIAHHEPVFKERWRNRSDIAWMRLQQLAPEKHAWFADRIKPALDAILVDLNETENKATS